MNYHLSVLADHDAVFSEGIGLGSVDIVEADYDPGTNPLYLS